MVLVPDSRLNITHLLCFLFPVPSQMLLKLKPGKENYVEGFVSCCSNLQFKKKNRKV